MRLTTRQREALWACEAERAQIAGRGEHPICAICDLPIHPGNTWDVNHEAHKPRWLGGSIDGISHRRCNRLNNNSYATPLFAKSERLRKRWMDFRRSRNPLPGGRDDPRKRTMDGRVVDRATGEAWRSR